MYQAAMPYFRRMEIQTRGKSKDSKGDEGKNEKKSTVSCC